MNNFYTDNNISQPPMRVAPENTETGGVLSIMQDLLDRYS